MTQDFEREEAEAEPEAESTSGAWSRVDVDSERPPHVAAGTCSYISCSPLKDFVLARYVIISAYQHDLMLCCVRWFRNCIHYVLLNFKLIVYILI